MLPCIYDFKQQNGIQLPNTTCSDVTYRILSNHLIGLSGVQLHLCVDLQFHGWLSGKGHPDVGGPSKK